MHANTASANRRSTRLPALDGIRALAVVTIIVFHVSQASGYTSAGITAPTLATMNAGVTIFFVLSGLVLMLPCARAIFAQAPLPDLRRYAARRCMRILPAYWLALVVLGLTSAGDGTFGNDWWRYFSLTQIYHSPTVVVGGLGGAWSLCTELSFYAFLPVIAVALARLSGSLPPQVAARRCLTVMGAIASVSILLRLTLSQGSPFAMVNPDHVVLATSLGGTLDWFCLGMALALCAAAWEADPSFAPWLRALSTRPWWCVGLAGAAFAGAVFSNPHDTFLTMDPLIEHVSLGLAAGALILAALGAQSRPGTRLSRVLGSGPSTRLGQASYGMYLWHYGILWLVAGTVYATAPQGLAVELGLFTATLALATLAGVISWRYLEQPAQRLARRFTTGRRTVDQPPSAQRAEPAFVGGR